MLAVFDLVNASSLSADIKQKSYSRRYEFIDDLGSDVNCLYSLYQKQEEISSGRKRTAATADTTTSSDATESASKIPKTTATSTAPTNTSSYQPSHNAAGHYGQNAY